MLNTYAKGNDLIKGKNSKPPSGDDLREGLTAIVSVKLPGPKFSSQTKDRLINTEVEGLVQTHFGQAFAEWLEENPKAAKQLVNKAIAAQQAREAARKARELARKDRKGLWVAAVCPINCVIAKRAKLIARKFSSSKVIPPVVLQARL